MIFTSYGQIIHTDAGAHVEVCPELARYYRAQIPFPTNKTRYNPHITVVRNEKWDVEFLDLTTFTFHYDHEVYWNDTYVWLAVECKPLEEFRLAHGLPAISEFTQSPDLRHRFHITIGNMKGMK